MIILVSSRRGQGRSETRHHGIQRGTLNNKNFGTMKYVTVHCTGNMCKYVF
jgi:hypothetical protein